MHPPEANEQISQSRMASASHLTCSFLLTSGLIVKAYDHSVMDVPQLTIITPVFNGVDNIVECLDNVRDQGCPGVEHLVVDGGSRDGTVEQVERRIAVDAGVRLLTGPDRGQSHAMNKGIVHARAPIIGFLNVDDRYAPGALARVIAALADAPRPSFLWGACELRDERKSSIWIQKPGRLESWRLASGVQPHPVNPASYFYHRELHERAGLYREAEHFALDVEFVLRAAQHCKRLYTDPTVLGYFNMAIGTKTDDDRLSGEQHRRLQRIRAEAFDRLSLGDRIRVRVFVPAQRIRRKSAKMLRTTRRRLRKT